MPHQKVRLDLLQGVETDTDDDQEPRSTEGEGSVESLLHEERQHGYESQEQRSGERDPLLSGTRTVLCDGRFDGNVSNKRGGG